MLAVNKCCSNALLNAFIQCMLRVWSSIYNNCPMFIAMIPVQIFMIFHYENVIMGTIASQITSLTIVYSTDYSDADQRKHQSSASLAFVWGIHRGPVNAPHKGPVTRKMFPFDDVIMHFSVNTYNVHSGEGIYLWYWMMSMILSFWLSLFPNTNITMIEFIVKKKTQGFLVWNWQFRR